MLYSVSLISCGEKTSTTETVTVYGEFYTLQEAYDNNLITFGDCKNMEESGVVAENYLSFDSAKAKKILHDYKQLHPVSSDDINIKYYGNFNGSSVVWITDMYYGNAFEKTPLSNSRAYCIYDKQLRKELRCLSHFIWFRVWRECESKKETAKPQKQYGVFYSLDRAKELGLFTSKDWENRVFGVKSDTKSKLENFIQSDYILIGVERDRDTKIGVYDPKAGYYDSSIYDTEIDFIGYINGYLWIRVKTLLFYDPYEQTYVNSVLWIPFEDDII